MAISDTITSMYDNVGNAYNVLTLAGADLTNVNKNLVNLTPTWKERLLYFINNGTDEVWNNWDKVTGEGEEISLNNTLEAKMKIELKGNTSQNTTTGKNLLNPIGTSSSQASITFTNNGDGTFTANGTASEAVNFNLTNLTTSPITLEANTTYTQTLEILSGTFGGSVVPAFKNSGGTIVYNYFNCNNSSRAHTLTTTDTMTGYAYNFHLNSGVSITNCTFRVQLEKGNSTSYEKYTGGIASPNPDYPQDIHVVSGDNSIEVCGKNLFDKDSATLNYRLGSSGDLYGDSNYLTSNFIKVNPSTTYTYTISDDSLSSRCYCFYNSNKEFISRAFMASTTRTISISTTSTTEYIKIADAKAINTFMLNEGTATTYEPYTGESYPISLGDKELLKIGTYQDKIDKSSGKNLFNLFINKSKGFTRTIQGITEKYNDDGSITYTGTSTAQIDFYITTAQYNSTENNIILDNDKFYTLSLAGNTNDNIKLYVGYGAITRNTSTSTTFQLNNNISWAFIRIGNGVTLNTTVFPMLNEGSTALPYEPYGTSWYLKKEIGKLLLNGQWVSSTNYTGLFTINNTASGINYISGGYSDHFKYENNNLIIDNGTANSNLTNNQMAFRLGTTKDRLYIKTDIVSSNTELQTWFSNNNTTVYYVLATPTYEPITDTTLISQLEEAKKSYESQTNISQTNNDLPFELDVVALSDGTISTLGFSLGNPLGSSQPEEEEPETLEEVLEEPEEEENDG